VPSEETAIPQHPHGTFEGIIGTRYDALDRETIRGHLDLRPELLGAGGAAPVGLYATVAEGAASMATGVGVAGDGLVVSGMANDTTRTGLVKEGRLTFEGRCRHRQPDLWVWDVEFRDPSDEVCALGTVRIAVRRIRP
jgi:acyl-coenzyme A thioesterase PaaI-like protein